MTFITFIANLYYYAIYGIMVIIVYLFSGKSVSEPIRKAFFANLFTSQWFVKMRKGMLDEHRCVWLKEFSQFENRNSSEKLKILEIGVGGGANFEVYPKNCRMTALDTNVYFKEKFMQSLKNYPNIHFDGYLTASVEDMNQIQDNTFDAVLITEVLCSVTDVPKGLSEIKRVLKEGGKLFFFEHVAYNEKLTSLQFWLIIQKILSPFYYVLCYNCQLTKHTWLDLERAGFKSIKINHSFPKSIPGFFRPHIWGWAQK